MLLAWFKVDCEYYKFFQYLFVQIYYWDFIISEFRFFVLFIQWEFIFTLSAESGWRVGRFVNNDNYFGRPILEPTKTFIVWSLCKMDISEGIIFSVVCTTLESHPKRRTSRKWGKHLYYQVFCKNEVRLHLKEVSLQIKSYLNYIHFSASNL